MAFFYQDNCQQRIGFLPASREDQSESPEVLNLDRSIDFLGGRKNVYIVASSEGFLLCCRQTTKYPELSYMFDRDANREVFNGQLTKEYPMEYYVYNPLTKQSLEIPQPPCCHKKVGVGFSVVDQGRGDDLVSFTIVRYGIPAMYLDSQSSVLVEIYSSETEEWTEMNMKLDSPKGIYPIENPGVVIDGVCFWLDSGRQLLAFDLVGKNFWFPDLPHPLEEIRHNHFYDLFGSKDHLYYIAHLPGLMRIWELQSDVRCTSPTSWVVKHEGLAISAMIDKLPAVLGPAEKKKYGRSVGFDPNLPQIMYFDFGSKLISVDVEKNTVEFVDKLWGSSHWIITMDYEYFPYEWSSKKARPVAAAAFKSQL